MFPQNSAVLVVGDPSAGMFEFCCYLSSVYLKTGEKVVFVETNTTADRARRMLARFGIDAYDCEAEEKLVIVDAYSPHAVPDVDPSTIRVPDSSRLSSLFEGITKGIETMGGQSVKVMFDSLTPLYLQHDPESVCRFLKDLITLCKYSGSLTCVVHKGILDEDQIAEIAGLTDSLMEMAVNESFRRFVRIKHIRGTAVTPKWVPFDFDRVDEEEEGTALIWRRGSG
jgi:KaiC/GvpD/RAD55 family RecA-like ATPase